jgi:uncharacterized protein
MRRVFVDTSGFFAVLDRTDPFHADSAFCFRAARDDDWRLLTTNYIVHEAWALIQRRLGWNALDDFHGVLLRRCEIIWVDQTLHELGAAKCMRERTRGLNLTDCVSIEFMRREGLDEAIAFDAHFAREKIRLPR